MTPEPANRQLTHLGCWRALGIFGLVCFGVLVFLGLRLVGIPFWARSFRTVLLLPHGRGLEIGDPVTYRGVRIGEVHSIQPEAEGVAVVVDIAPADRLVPIDSLIQVAPGEKEGDRTLDIIPRKELPSDIKIAKPLDRNCDPNLILCSQGDLETTSQLQTSLRNLRLLRKQTSQTLQTIDTLGVNTDAFLAEVRQEQLVRSINLTLIALQKVIEKLSKLSDDTSGMLSTIRQNRTIEKISQISGDGAALLQEVRRTQTLNSLNSTLVSVRGTSEEIRTFMAINRIRLTDTLTSLGQTSKQLNRSLRRLDPLAQQLEQTQLLGSLEQIATNTASLTSDLRKFSGALSDPQTLHRLRTLLAATESLILNLNKVTSDVDELTGNPRFREDVLQLIHGLSKLFSLVQKFSEQLSRAEVLDQVATQNPKSSGLRATSTIKKSSTEKTVASPGQRAEDP
jgi:phospholipid/cholesterol/gamma-HCH transport system substrate-binding protein